MTAIEGWMLTCIMFVFAALAGLILLLYLLILLLPILSTYLAPASQMSTAPDFAPTDPAFTIPAPALDLIPAVHPLTPVSIQSMHSFCSKNKLLS